MLFELISFLEIIVLLSIVFVGPMRLNLRQDFFFMIFILLGAMYIYVSPALVMIDQDPLNLAYLSTYPEIQFLVSTLFLLPCLIIYSCLKNSICRLNFSNRTLVLSNNKLVALCIFLLLFEVIFIVLAIWSDMYIRRISSEKIAVVISQLNPYVLLIVRTHDLLTLPAIAILTVILPSLKLQTSKYLTWLTRLTLLLMVISYAVFALLNSRTFLIYLVIALVFARIASNARGFKLSATRVILMVIIIFYGFILISNIRNKGIDASAIDILNPISMITESDSDAFNKREWSQRLDCIDLIAQMDSSLNLRGYEWGQAWERPLVSMFGPIVGHERATELKAEAITTAKTYLMEEHTNLPNKDYPSCMVTDLWGNFWIFGLPIASILVAFIFASIRYGLTKSISPTVFVTSVVMAFYLMSFEREFVDWFFGWMKLLPAIFLLAILNPIKKFIINNKLGVSS